MKVRNTPFPSGEPEEAYRASVSSCSYRFPPANCRTTDMLLQYQQDAHEKAQREEIRLLEAANAAVSAAAREAHERAQRETRIIPEIKHASARAERARADALRDIRSYEGVVPRFLSA